MPRVFRVAIVSDVHYASPAEQARGSNFELQWIKNPASRLLVRSIRRFVWLHQPLNKNYLLEKFLSQAGTPDCVVANGDYSCDTAFVGVSDDAALQSARECLDQLRGRFNGRFHASIGDHEFGKISFL